MDTGPAKTRRRTTANTAPLSGAMAMTHAQWATLVTFYQETLSAVLPFDMPKPFDTESTHSVRFTAPPSKTDFSPARVRVQLELEVMPS